MLRLGRERGEVNVVSDQTGCPTYAGDLAKAVLDVLPHCESFIGPEIFHFTNQGSVSWYGFAAAIFEIAGMDCRVNPILTKDYPTAAKRPLYSILDTSKIMACFGLKIPPWKDSLQLCLERMKEMKT